MASKAPIGLLQVLDRLIGLAEQEDDPAEIVQDTTDVRPVAALLVELLGVLGVGASDEPFAFALVDEEGRKFSGPRGRVADRVGELERGLDVGARGSEVPLMLVRARAPVEDLGAQAFAGTA